MRTLKSNAKAAAVVFSLDSRMLASGGDDKTVKLWDAASGRLLSTLVGHTNAITSVAFSRDDRIVASGSFDDTIKLWDVSDAKT